jgi:hypothetical protein
MCYKEKTILHTCKEKVKDIPNLPTFEEGVDPLESMKTLTMYILKKCGELT